MVRPKGCRKPLDGREFAYWKRRVGGLMGHLDGGIHWVNYILIGTVCGVEGRICRECLTKQGWIW